MADSANLEWTLHCDGASRGNPGPAATGCVLKNSEGQVLFDGGSFLGRATNNEAEYGALIEGLQKAEQAAKESSLPEKEGRFQISLKIYMDSELVVKQVNGVYRVKNERMKELHSEASSLLRKFSSVSVASIRREKNKEADAAANRILDREPKDSLSP